jgi:AraC-like DNA-binding protein
MPPLNPDAVSSAVVAQAGSTLLALLNFVEGVQCWVKDRNGVYCWVNRAFLLNYSLDASPDAVLGKTDYDLSPKHLADQFRLDDAQVIEGDSILNRLELVGRFDHVSHWCLTTKLPVRQLDGFIAGTAGLTRMASAGELNAQSHPDLGLSRALTFVRENHAAPISNQSLASISGRSVRALERLFVRELRLTPQQYLRRIRVRLSCQDLIFSQWSLSEVALRHGFCDQSHFTREFRLETQMTPKTYRLRYRCTGEAAPF